MTQHVPPDFADRLDAIEASLAAAARIGSSPPAATPTPIDPSIPYPPITPLLTLRARRLLHHLSELTCTEPAALAGFILERALQTECMILEEIAQTPTEGPPVPGLEQYDDGLAAIREFELGNEAIMDKLTHEGTLTP